LGPMLGNDAFRYEVENTWAQLPPGWNFLECAGVAVDSEDNVYVLSRGPHPVIVFDSEGRFQRAFGEGRFIRPHGISVSPDGTIYCADERQHVIFRFSPSGELLMTLGSPNKSAEKWSGEPFNRPTHATVSRRSGYLYITDGYGNGRVHRFTADGKRVVSWGRPGVDPGQFMAPHNVAIDENERVYVADRENHRVQVFDENGSVLAVWHDIHRPDGLTLGPDGNVYIGELSGLRGLEDAPGVGHRISILAKDGNLLARLGDDVAGEEPGQFIAPHGIAVNSRGDVFVAEASYSILGSRLTPPREVKSLTKLKRIG
jgi:DNA-binding beta-propeller fold protein YncE